MKWCVMPSGPMEHTDCTPSLESVAHDEFIRHQAFIKEILAELGFKEIDVWEADGAKLDASPGSGVDKSRDLRNMPILVGLTCLH